MSYKILKTYEFLLKIVVRYFYILNFAVLNFAVSFKAQPMKYTFIILLFLIKNTSIAQKITSQVIDASGGTHRANGYSMTYSLGQTAVTMLKSSNYIITQGFQQPLNNGTTESEETQSIDFQATVFPNPTSALLNLNLQGNLEQTWQMQIVNIKGQIVRNETLQQAENQFDVSNFPNGEYFILLKGKNGVLQAKFLKID